MAQFSADYQPQRRRGNGWRAHILKALADRGLSEEAFASELVARALDDASPQAGRIMAEILARLAPLSKSAMPLVEIQFPAGATATQRADAIIDGIATGHVPADIGVAMVSAISTRMAIFETEQLATRLAALEAIVERTRAS